MEDSIIDFENLMAAAETEKSAARITELERLHNVTLARPMRLLLTEGTLTWISADGAAQRNVAALLCSDALVLVALPGSPQQAGRGSSAVIELPLVSATVTSHLASQRTTPDLRDAFSIATAEHDPVSLRAPNPTSAEVWLARLTSGIADAATPDARLDIGWLHRRVRGTLWSAALEGDAKTVRELCAYTATARANASTAAMLAMPIQPVLDVDAVASGADDGMTPLHCAVLGGSPECVTALLEVGRARLDVVDSDFATPLHIAATRGAADIAIVLIANGASLTARNLIEQTPLEVALASVRDDDALCSIAETMLVYGAVAGERDLDGLMPLHRLCIRAAPSTARLVQAIVRHGADVDATARIGDDDLTPLLIASGAPVPASARAASLGYVSDDEDELQQEGEDGGDPTESPPQHHGRPCLELVEALLRVGAAPNTRVGSHRQTALHAALQAGSSNAAEAAAVALVESGARFDVADAAGIMAAELIAKLPDSFAHSLASARSRFLLASMPAGATDAAIEIAARVGQFRRRGCRRGAASTVAAASTGSATQQLVASVARLWGGGGGTAAAKVASTKSIAAACTACGAAAEEPSCGWCGGHLCSRCGSHAFPLPPEVDSDYDDAESGASSHRMATFTPWRHRPGVTVADVGVRAGGGGVATTLTCCDPCFNVLSLAAVDVISEQARRRTATESGMRNVVPAAPAADVLALQQRIQTVRASRESSTKPAHAITSASMSGATARYANNALAPRTARDGDDVNREALFGTAVATSSAASDRSARRIAREQRSMPPTGAGSRQAASGLADSLAETRVRLGQRGERLSAMQDSSADLANDAAHFGSLATQLKEKYKARSSFFGF